MSGVEIFLILLVLFVAVFAAIWFVNGGSAKNKSDAEKPQIPLDERVRADIHRGMLDALTTCPTDRWRPVRDELILWAETLEDALGVAGRIRSLKQSIEGAVRRNSDETMRMLKAFVDAGAPADRVDGMIEAISQSREHLGKIIVNALEGSKQEVDVSIRLLNEIYGR